MATPALSAPSPQLPASAKDRAARRWSQTRSVVYEKDRNALMAYRSELRARGVADTTLRNYDSNLRTAAVRMERPLLEATTTDLRAYLGRDGIGNGTRNTIHAALSSFYRFAQVEGYVTVNPMERVRRAKAPRGKPRPLSAEQIDAMLNSGAYANTRAMILLGCYQGFRVSSIARVHSSDIDLDAGTIRTVGKGSKEAILPLHPVIAELSHSMPQNGWWFPARHGADGPVQPSSVSDLIRKAILRAGIHDPKLTPHSLRHSFGTDLVTAGIDIRVIQELMMHADLSTTQIYAGVSDERMRNGVHALPGRPIPARAARRRPTDRSSS